MADEATMKSDAPDPSPEQANSKSRKVRARRKGASPKGSKAPPRVQTKTEAALGLTPIQDHPLPPAPLDSARDAALRRKGVTETPLRVDMTRYLNTAGGFDRVMSELVPMVAEIDQRYRNLLAEYQRTSDQDRRALYPEDYLYVCQIRPSDFYGEVSRAAMEYAIQTGILQQAMAHQGIMETGLGMAQTPLGVADRMAHLKATGVTPLPKGAQVAIQNVYGGGSQGQGPGGNGQSGGGQAADLPTFERQMIGDGSHASTIEDADFEEIPNEDANDG